MVKLQTRKTIIYRAAKPKMFKSIVISILSWLLTSAVFSIFALGQANSQIPYKSSEMAEKEGVPVLMLHLPEWESVRSQAKFARDASSLKAILGDRSVIDLIDFQAGAEAATATYPAGKLLIVEFPTPQASIESDFDFAASVAKSDASTVYRRIGNYNAFVFDASDTAAANALLDQVKYQKQVQWLGKNPFLISPERAFVLQTSDLFFATVMIVVIGIGFSIGGGLLAGFMFYRLRAQRRASMATFTDAGGMTRLNLDGFTPDIMPERLLGE